MNNFQGLDTEEFIDSSRISVVVQGLTHYIEGDSNCLFYQCINSIKDNLPEAEIIVSTWVGQKCDTTVIDRAIFNVEPNTIVTSKNLNNQWNFNKMIVSTVNGLHLCSREYVLKIRTDLILTGTDFFKVCRKKNIPEKFNKFKIFDDPINITNLFVKNPFSYHHFLFHISDIVQFGKINNMMDLWGRVLVDESELCFNLKWNSAFNYYTDTQMKRTPEQSLMLGWMKSHEFDVNLPYSTYVSKDFLRLSELLISVNFNVFEWSNSNIIFPDRFIDNKKVLTSYIYAAEHLNYLYLFYDCKFYFFCRVIKLYLNFYIFKYFNFDFFDNFIRTFLFWFSPSLFFKLKMFWRKLLHKGVAND